MPTALEAHDGKSVTMATLLSENHQAVMTGSQQAGGASAASIAAAVLIPTSVYNFYLSHSPRTSPEKAPSFGAARAQAIINGGFGIERIFAKKKNLHVL